MKKWTITPSIPSFGAALTAFESTYPETESESHNNVSAAVFFGERYAPPTKPNTRPRDRQRGGIPKAGRNVLDVMSSLRSPNRIKSNLSASRLAQLKARTRCLRFHKKGHWRHECPDRSGQSTKQVMMSLVRDVGNDDTAVAAVLWALSEDDDEYYAYVSQSAIMDNFQSDDNHQQDTMSNSFEAFIADTVTIMEYGNQEAIEDIRSCFEVMIDEHTGPGSDSEEQQAFWQPASH